MLLSFFSLPTLATASKAAPFMLFMMNVVGHCWTAVDTIGHQWTVQTMEWRELFLQLTPIGCSQLAAARLIFLPICSAKVGQSDADETSDLTSGQMEKLAKPHTKFPNNPVILF